MGDITILKTAHIYETDMLAAALKEEGVPHFLRMDSLTAGEFAMPALPVQGPGMFYKVVVPEEAAEHAREILMGLPITNGEPEFWSYRPQPWAKKLTWWAALVTLGGLLLSIVWSAAETVLEQGWFE